jgi:hypothetical protein
MSNGDNVWQTDLKIIAELIDVQSGRVAWRGVGEATRIQEGSRELDFGVLIVQGDRADSLETLASQMVSIAAEGIANQIR